MGGIKKGFGAGGRFWRSVNKVVDPLNIMDPMGVLPTSMITGKKPFQFDKNFGKLQWNLGGGQTSYYSMPRSQINTSDMFANQNQILANMQAQSSANAAKQQASLDQLRSSSPIFPTTATSQTTSPNFQTTSTITTPATIAQSKIDSTISVANDLPIEFSYKPATSIEKNVAANTFTLPDMSNIKFGGT